MSAFARICADLPVAGSQKGPYGGLKPEVGSRTGWPNHRKLKFNEVSPL